MKRPARRCVARENSTRTTRCSLRSPHTNELLARDYSSALDFAQQATAVGPSFWIGHLRLAEVYERLGNSELALKALEKADALSGNSKISVASGIHPGEIGAHGMRPRKCCARWKGIDREGYVPPYAIALVYAGLGQRDAAFEWLERAYEVRDVHLVFVAAGDPKWDALREDPRFRALVERCDFMRRAKTTGRTER